MTLVDSLTNYATYHRDRRNVATHFIGIPMIVVAIVTLLARPAFPLTASLSLSPAMIATVAAVGFYLSLDLRYGAVMAVLMGLAVWAGGALASGSTTLWLASGLGLFAVGWVFQFVGHAFEGRKPAFVDDLIGLLIGPLFVVAEAGFALGLRSEVHAAIEHGVAARGHASAVSATSAAA